MKTTDQQILGRLETCARWIGQLDVMADAERRARGNLVDEARAAGIPTHRIAAALGVVRQPTRSPIHKPAGRGNFCSACGGDLVITSVSVDGYDTTCQKCGTDQVLATLEGSQR